MITIYGDTYVLCIYIAGPRSAVTQLCCNINDVLICLILSEMLSS